MPWRRNTILLWALYKTIFLVPATHSIYIAAHASIVYSVCKALVVQRIEPTRPKGKIEVQFFSRAQNKNNSAKERPVFVFAGDYWEDKKKTALCTKDSDAFVVVRRLRDESTAGELIHRSTVLFLGEWYGNESCFPSLNQEAGGRSLFSRTREIWRQLLHRWSAPGNFIFRDVVF
jgi:hypothetical protein